MLTMPTACPLDSFCRTHWRRLHAAACQRGCTSAEAEDAVQDVFLSLARRGVLEALANRPVEAQTSYLFLRLRCVLLNRWRDAHRQRRWALSEALPLDDELVSEPPTHVTPATEADRPWLEKCITLAIEKLRLQTREKTWDQVRPALLNEGEVAQSGAQRVAVHRARQRLRHLLREEMNGSFRDWNVG